MDAVFTENGEYFKDHETVKNPDSENSEKKTDENKSQREDKLGSADTEARPNPTYN